MTSKVSEIPWNKFRDSDGYIDLIKVYEYKYNVPSNSIPDNFISLENTFNYLRDITEIQPTKSRQVASMAIVTAHYLNKDK